MAHVTKARSGQLSANPLGHPIDNPDGIHASEALVALEKRVGITEYEAGDYNSGGRRFERLVRFGTVPAVKAGWMTKHKGIWSVTEEGREAVAKFQDEEQFFREAERLYWKWRKAQPASADDDSTEEAAEGSAAITLEQAEEMAWKEIEEYLGEMPPYDFQEMVGELLKAMGYHVAWIAPPGQGWRRGRHRLQRPARHQAAAHQGAGQAQRQFGQDRRCWSAQLHGGLGEGDVGLYVALSGFTKDADLEARQSHRRITLRGYIQIGRTVDKPLRKAG